MSKHWVKEELHKDTLASGVDKTVSWVRGHREFLGGAAITVVVLGLLAAYFLSRVEKTKEEAWDKYFTAQQLAYQGKSQESAKLLDELKTSFPNTEAAGYAALFKADMLYRMKGYKEAAQAYAQIPTAKNKQLAPFADLGALLAKAAASDYTGAIGDAQSFLIKHPNSPLTPQAYLAMASAYQAMGNTASAQETYKKITTLYPNSAWTELVKGKVLTDKK